MKPIRIFRHLACEGPGYLLDLIAQHGFDHELITIDTGMAVPPQVDDVSGLIFMGGPMSVNDPLPWIDDELQLIRLALKKNIPVLGICLGSQLMAKALGVRVTAGPCMELGWLPIHQTRESLWSEGLPDSFEVFHWHGETFELPAGAHLLFASDKCAHQGFALGPHLALQFHVEVTAAMIEEWLQLNSADFQRRCYTTHDASAVRAETPEKIQSLHDTAKILLGRWLNGCK